MSSCKSLSSTCSDFSVCLLYGGPFFDDDNSDGNNCTCTKNDETLHVSSEAIGDVDTGCGISE